MDATHLFKCFSEPVRLRLLHLLSNTRPELCVCDLVSVLEISQTTVSRHLAYLRNAALVTDRREGQWIYYRLAPATSKAHAALLRCLKTCFHDDPQLTDDLQRFGTLQCGDTTACCTPALKSKSASTPRKGSR